MVAGGTGITPIYQIIQYICECQKEGESPNINLLFANRTEDDILLLPALDAYQKQNSKLKISYSVDKSITSNWKGYVGFVDEIKIKQTIPENLE